MQQSTRGVIIMKRLLKSFGYEEDVLKKLNKLSRSEKRKLK